MAGKAVVLSLEKLGLIVLAADAGTDKEVSRVKTAMGYPFLDE